MHIATYTALAGLALLAGGGLALQRSPPQQRLPTFDVLLGGLLGGILLGRIEHVLFNWNHFSFHTREIPQVQAGGLEWHGALLGAGLGMLLMARWRRVALLPLVASLTLLLPLFALALWGGCWEASCHYGREVANLSDYPTWLVWDGRDIFGIYAPRFHTQRLGMFASAALLVFALLLFWRGWLVDRRFWLVLMLLAGSLFVIGFLEGDYHPRWQQLRLSQYLDAIVGVYAGCLALWPPRPRRA